MQLSLIIALAIFAGCVLIAVLFGQHFGQHNAEQSAPGKQTAPAPRATEDRKIPGRNCGGGFAARRTSKPNRGLRYCYRTMLGLRFGEWRMA